MVNSKLNRKLINSGDNALVGEPGFLKLPFVIIICFFCTVPLLSSIPPLLNPSPPQTPPPPRRSLPSLTPPLRNPSPLQRAGITSFCFFGKREFSSGHTQGARHSGSCSIWLIIRCLAWWSLSWEKRRVVVFGLRPKKEVAHGTSRQDGPSGRTILGCGPI